jgi:peptidylprolyl isomerase
VRIIENPPKQPRQATEDGTGAVKHETSAAIVNRCHEKGYRGRMTIAAAAVAFAGISMASCKRVAPPTAEKASGKDAADAIDYSGQAPPDVANPPADAQATASGLRTRVLQSGSGRRHPTKDDFVEVGYAGWTRGGQFFEGTGDGERVRFDRTKVIPGLDEGIGLMVEGERRRLWIPHALAYATQPRHVNAPSEDMTFDVELLRIVPIPPVPEDVARAPRSALRKKSGLVFRYLKHGGGTTHPASDARLSMQWSMWTSEGRRIFTSLLVKDVVEVAISNLTPGMQEAARSMVEGDKLRVWLPGKLGYGDPIPGQDQLPFAPQLGPLVIDMELFGDR